MDNEFLEPRKDRPKKVEEFPSIDWNINNIKCKIMFDILYVWVILKVRYTPTVWRNK